MMFINYLADLLFRHQKKLEFVAILLLCLAVTFQYHNSKTTWLWNDYTFVAVILAIAIVVIALIWIRIEKIKTTNLINDIKQEDISLIELKKQNPSDELSSRQKEVFDLILAGKSNKEIMSELSIEQSTLKTHINKIYKVLDIDSRKQIKKFKNKEG